MKNVLFWSVRLGSVRLGSLLVATVAIGGGLACQTAVNLDVKYTDAGAGGGGEGGNGEAGADGAINLPVDTTLQGQELEGCPCDVTQGLACCASAVGPAFCTTDQDRCNSEKGAFYKCFYGDPNSESVCCYHGSGASTISALSAGCDGGVEACLATSQCPSGKPCQTIVCHGVTIGACGQAPPACPP